MFYLYIKIREKCDDYQFLVPFQLKGSRKKKLHSKTFQPPAIGKKYPSRRLWKQQTTPRLSQYSRTKYSLGCLAAWLTEIAAIFGHPNLIQNPLNLRSELLRCLKCIMERHDERVGDRLSESSAVRKTVSILLTEKTLGEKTKPVGHGLLMFICLQFVKLQRTSKTFLSVFVCSTWFRFMTFSWTLNRTDLDAKSAADKEGRYQLSMVSCNWRFHAIISFRSIFIA